MAQIIYRGNLSAKAIPLLTDFQGRTVIVPGQDNTFNRAIAAYNDQDQDVGIPSIYYAHNVMPAPYGFHSVGYEQAIAQVTDGTSGFTSARIIRSNPISAAIDGPRVYFSPKSGQCYKLALGDTTWTGIGGPTYPSYATVTYATVQGITYINFSNIGCYKFDSTSNTLISVTLDGLNPLKVVGISGYQGYLIAYDDSSLYWSSVLDIDYTLNVVDFIPSLTTGAGQIRLEGAKGPIKFVIPATFGLAIYTSSNIVSAVYSGNSRYPFNFKEIVSSGGGISQDLIAYDANTGNQYTYTTSGLQTVTATATQTIFPELTDFLAGQSFEDFDEVTNSFTLTDLTSPMVKKMTSISDRYLIISYGISSLTHAIVYDMSQKRYGKLKIDHVDCFEFEYLDPAVTDAPRKSIAFLTPTGVVWVANLSITFAQSKGVIVLGKFQYVRTRTLTIEKAEFQSVHANQEIGAYLISSHDGGTIQGITPRIGYAVSQTANKQKEYRFHDTALNHSLLLVGGFSLSSFVLTFHINGRR